MTTTFYEEVETPCGEVHTMSAPTLAELDELVEQLLADGAPAELVTL